MVTKSDSERPPASEEAEGSQALAPAEVPASPAATPEEQAAVPLGAQRYVHAAFFVAAILVAYLSSKVLDLVWNSLVDWPAAVRAVPQLVGYSEEQRGSITMGAGALIGLASVIQVYRRAGIRAWADGVASELTKVTWPNREAVINGTVVVVIASAIATAYVAILDRFWGFLTTLVYGT